MDAHIDKKLRTMLSPSTIHLVETNAYVCFNNAKSLRTYPNSYPAQVDYIGVAKALEEHGVKLLLQLIKDNPTDGTAMSSLALCYTRGRGVAANKIKANALWRRASAMGSEPAHSEVRSSYTDRVDDAHINYMLLVSRRSTPRQHWFTVQTGLYQKAAN